MDPSKAKLLLQLALGEAIIIIALGLALIQASQPVSTPVFMQPTNTPASPIQSRVGGTSFSILAATALPVIESTPLPLTATPIFVPPPTASSVPALPVQPALPNDQPAIPVQPGMPPPAATSVYTPLPTSVPVQACDLSYPDFCIPSPPPDLDCDDISQKNFTVIGADPHGFDRDHNGRGCEQ